MVPILLPLCDFSFIACIIEGSMSLKSKAILNNQNASARLMSTLQYLETLQHPSQLSATSIISFTISSIVNLVKLGTSGQFSPGGIYYFGHEGFFCNNFSMV